MDAAYRQMLREEAEKQLKEGTFRASVIAYTLQALAESGAASSARTARPASTAHPSNSAACGANSSQISDAQKPKTRNGAEEAMSQVPRKAVLTQDPHLANQLDTWELMTERLRRCKDKDEALHARSVLESVCDKLEEKVSTQLQTEEKTIYKDVREHNPKLRDFVEQLTEEHNSLRLGFREVRELLGELQTELLRGKLNGEAKHLSSACQDLLDQLRRHIRRDMLLLSMDGAKARA